MIAGDWDMLKARQGPKSGILVGLYFLRACSSGRILLKYRIFWGTIKITPFLLYVYTI
jgi:hypothetical protein